MSSPVKLIDEYLRGPAILRAAVSEMSHEQLCARPVPEKWSTLEVVCHLVDTDIIYADRMKRVAAEDGPEIWRADERRYAQELGYQDRDCKEELAVLELLRKHTARILRMLPPKAFARTALHHAPGQSEPRTLERYLTQIIEHIPQHVRFIEEKRQALDKARR